MDAPPRAEPEAEPLIHPSTRWPTKSRRSATAGRRSPTILDLAREAGVSKTTVSRVLNDSPKVAVDTQARVKEAMKPLGFRVNLAARTLRTTRSALVGLLVPTIDNEIFGRVAQTLTTELANSSVGLVISTSNWDSRAELRALQSLESPASMPSRCPWSTISILGSSSSFAPSTVRWYFSTGMYPV